MTFFGIDIPFQLPGHTGQSSPKRLHGRQTPQTAYDKNLDETQTNSIEGKHSATLRCQYRIGNRS
jgi:hypothetical protein